MQLFILTGEQADSVAKALIDSKVATKKLYVDTALKKILGELFGINVSVFNYPDKPFDTPYSFNNKILRKLRDLLSEYVDNSNDDHYYRPEKITSKICGIPMNTPGELMNKTRAMVLDPLRVDLVALASISDHNLKNTKKGHKLDYVPILGVTSLEEANTLMSECEGSVCYFVGKEEDNLAPNLFKTIQLPKKYDAAKIMELITVPEKVEPKLKSVKNPDGVVMSGRFGFAPRGS